MTPSDETIKAYLALPLKARQALADQAEGPGWRHYEATGKTVMLAECGETNLVQYAGAWIPASEAETLRVWAVAFRPALDNAAHEDKPYREYERILRRKTEIESVDVWTPYDSRLRAAAECCPVDVFADTDEARAALDWAHALAPEKTSGGSDV